MRYWLQTRAPAGNWVDNTGANDKARLIEYCGFHRGRGEDVRVVERTDREVWPLPSTDPNHAADPDD